MNWSQALSRSSSFRFIRKNLLKNSVGLRDRHRVVEAFPGFLKLKKFAGNIRPEMVSRILRIFNHAVQFQCRAKQPFTFQLVLRKLFWRWLMLDDFAVLTLEIIVDKIQPGREE